MSLPMTKPRPENSIGVLPPWAEIVRLLPPGTTWVDRITEVAGAGGWVETIHADPLAAEPQLPAQAVPAG